MKGFNRQNQLFALCGLNCGLCPMFLSKHCPGCGGGEGNQSCKIARCSMEHGGIEYCFQCGEYPCPKYDHIEDYDVFITGRKKTLFCVAVNLLELQELQEVLRQIENRSDLETLTLKEKSALAAGLLKAVAAKNDIDLKLRKKK